MARKANGTATKRLGGRKATRAKQKAASPGRASRSANGVGSLESQIGRLARTGQLGKAAKRAIREQKKKGIPITFQRGQEIIKQYADGREEVLGTIGRPSYVLPKGVRIIRGQ